jgi:hypothetical protein
VDAGDRWRPLLLMLGDTWSSSYWQPTDQELLQLRQQLQNMTVSQNIAVMGVQWVFYCLQQMRTDTQHCIAVVKWSAL